jgi:hypothetical protein
MHPHIGYICLTRGDLLSGDQAHIYTSSSVPLTVLDIFVDCTRYDKNSFHSGILVT